MEGTGLDQGEGAFVQVDSVVNSAPAGQVSVVPDGTGVSLTYADRPEIGAGWFLPVVALTVLSPANDASVRSDTTGLPVTGTHVNGGAGVIRG